MSADVERAAPADRPAERTTSGFMHIGEVATRTQLSLRSLRHWEEVGLLQPSGRTHGGFRLYTEHDVDKILFIRRMKPLGFSLEQMKAVLADVVALEDPATDPTEREAAAARLDLIHDDAVGRRAALVRQVEMADEFIGRLTART
ncbi:MAG: MerR family transcriptional regulator [Nocardioides sp.]|nr:MerR family transcriptional regulator [Nocardioides sp.]